MGTVTDNVTKYRRQGYTCAESTLLAANDAWDLGLKEDSIKLMGGFGGGMHCGYVCGAISGGIAALSSKYRQGSGHNSPLLSVKCKLFVETVEKRLGYLRCDELAPIYKTPDGNCTPTVLKITEILDEIDAVEIDIPEHSDYDLRFPPEGKPGFAYYVSEAEKKLQEIHDNIR